MNKVVASAIIYNQEGKVLLIKGSPEKGGYYSPIGGKLELNETLRETVIRECKEEIGVDIEVINLAGIYERKYDDGYWVFVYYACKILNGTPQILEPNKIVSLEYRDITDIEGYNDIKWLESTMY